MALPPSLGTFLTHRQCPGGCISHLQCGGRQVGQAEPQPHGERDAFSSDSSIPVCLWRERQQLQRVGVALLFSVYWLCSLSFPTWGTTGLKGRVQHFVVFFNFFFSPLPMKGESLVPAEEAGKWRREEGEGISLLFYIQNVQRVYWHLLT